MDATERPCSKCGDVYPNDSFAFKGAGRRGGRKDGRESQCRECVRRSQRKPRTCAGCGCSYEHVGKAGSRRVLCDECMTVGRVCHRCKEFKPFERFYGDPSRKVGAYCKDGCALANNRERLYGITREEHDKLIDESGDVCQICRKPGVRMSLDHDHKTGAVRGIICGSCNLILGHSKDSVDTLLGAIAYLKKHAS